MKKLLVLLVAILLTLLVLGNPNQKEFEKTAEEHAELYSYGEISSISLPEYFQNIILDNFENMIKRSVEVENYYVLSIAKRQYSNVDGTSIIGVGVLWMYFDVSHFNG